MDNFGIYKLISSLKGASCDNFDKNPPLSMDKISTIEQLIKMVFPIITATANTNNMQKKEPSKTKNKTGATAEILRRHDDFVQKVYKSHGKIYKG